LLIQDARSGFISIKANHQVGIFAAAIYIFSRILYHDKKMLMGLFVLSNVFRVKQDQQDQYRLVLPGGEAAESSWSQIVGSNPSSFDFLHHRSPGTAGNLITFMFFLIFFRGIPARK
jgi:hypothetical protein